jgi:hypothetical protein
MDADVVKNKHDYLPAAWAMSEVLTQGERPNRSITMPWPARQLWLSETLCSTVRLLCEQALCMSMPFRQTPIDDPSHISALCVYLFDT